MSETKNLSNNTIKRNIIISIAAQVISLLVSFLLNIIVPKLIPEVQYAYWQSFILYIGYVGILHFGILDGIVLRYSQYDYDEIDKARMRSQFKSLLIIDSIFSLLVSGISIIFVEGILKWIIIFVGIGITTKNLFTYTSYTFQITNRIKKYALLVILQRVFYGLIVVLLLITKRFDFYWFCIAELFSDIFSVVVASFFNKGMYFGKSLSLNDTLDELKINIKSGIKLMLSNWSALLLISSAKMIIQFHWGYLIFGKISFSFSITNLFLTFIAAASFVVFPSLKRLNSEDLPKIYKKMRFLLSNLLLFCLLFYYPCCKILNLWLPQYNQSLVYLGVLLPIIIYSSKVNLLTNNYLKNYRKEQLMMYINIFTTVLGIIIFSITSFVFNNLELTLFSIVSVVILNSLLSEIVITKIINISIIKDFLIELILVIIFMVSVYLTSDLIAFFIYLSVFILHLLLNIPNFKKYFINKGV